MSTRRTDPQTPATEAGRLPDDWEEMTTGEQRRWVAYAIESREEFISKVEHTLGDMAPMYHEMAIATDDRDDDDDRLHPGVTWDRCPDPLCARARALLGAEPGYPPRENPNE